MKLRLCCLYCGRNLADVTYNSHNPDWTCDKLTVTRRPNVEQKSYRPWSPNGNANKPAEGQDYDWHDRTYEWHCRCGKTHQRRHEWITQEWADAKATRDTRRSEFATIPVYLA